MKVLIVGGGGREHAIAVSMKKSKRVDKLYCVPGNAGIAQIAECEPSIGVMEFDKIVSYATQKECCDPRGKQGLLQGSYEKIQYSDSSLRDI